jgi:hypothetical protein
MLHHSTGVRLGESVTQCRLPATGMSHDTRDQQGQRTRRRRARGTGRQVVMNSLAPSQSARLPTICRRHRKLFSHSDQGSPLLLC